MATTVLAAMFFGEHLGRRVIIGVALVVAAGVSLGWSGAPQLRVGALLIVGACLCWGLDKCVTANLGQIAPEQITLAKGVLAGGTNLVLGFALHGSFPPGRLVLLALAVGAAAVLGSWHDHDHVHPAVVHEHEHEHQHDDDHHEHRHLDEDPIAGLRHSHVYEHQLLVHAHPHVPDLHHRHDHEVVDVYKAAAAGLSGVGVEGRKGARKGSAKRRSGQRPTR